MFNICQLIQSTDKNGSTIAFNTSELHLGQSRKVVFIGAVLSAGLCRTTSVPSLDIGLKG